ncbi:hypothetical protein BN8_03775 [Fibrisoma limi BUZ 3]|uniref:Uncharacterized protein n=1 Tax=Fibrisoma limi BUZ 3 TaxID=1185876 RepID=I2GL15_9BACT|nr:hypothetical protein [Fibrisoma limi]CCH54591.1 hypothetical protein BN8_03775 [Fibrisoma limi BUZ 3]
MKFACTFIIVLIITTLSEINIVKGQTISLRYNEYDISDKHAQDTILLEINRPDPAIPLAQLTIEKKGVRFNKRSDQQLFNAFKIDSTPINNNIRVIVDTRVTQNTGSYELSLDVSSNKPLNTLLIKFNHSPAIIKNIEELTIEQELYHYGNPTIVKQPILRIQETSGSSKITTRLTDILVTNQIMIDFEQDSINLNPNQQTDLTYTTKGNFPLGPLKGSFEINAPQLTSAKQINYNIITKRPYWYIPITLIMGIALSFLFKTVLSNYISLNESKLIIYELITLIKKDQQKHLDEEFNKKCNTIISDLVKEAKSRPSFRTAALKLDQEKKRVEDFLNDKRDEFNELVKDLNKRREITKSAFEELISLPKFTSFTLQSILYTVLLSKEKTIENYFIDDNIYELSKLLTSIKMNLVLEVSKSIIHWKNKIDNLLPILESHLKPYSETDLELFNKLIAIRTAVIKSPKNFPEVKTSIPITNELQTNLEDVIKLYSLKIIQTLYKVEPLIRQYYSSMSSYEELSTKITSYIQLIRSAAPEDLVQVISKNYKDIANAWREVVYQSPLSGLDKGIDNDLINHRYEDAVQKAITIIKNSAGGLALQANAAMVLNTNKQIILQHLSSSFTTNTNVLTIPFNSVFQASSQLDREIIENRIISFKSLRTALVLIGIIFIGCMIYKTTFIGTIEELFGIFIWAFTFDLSINTAFDYLTTGLQKSKTIIS